MIINLNKLLEKKSAILNIDRDMANFLEEIDVKRSIFVDGIISVENEELTIDLDVKLNICLACTRCLEDFIYPLDFRIYEKLEKIKEKEHEILKSDTLDLTELIRDNILVNIPMKTLCKEDCKGLCDQCGVDKNIEDCNCDANYIDPRLDVLKNLLDDAE